MTATYHSRAAADQSWCGGRADRFWRRAEI